MRITIDTDGPDGLTVSRDEEDLATGQTALGEATDGGSPPQELLDRLTAETAGDDDSVEAGDFPDEEGEELSPLPGSEDAGEAPTWLVDVIENQSVQDMDGFADS